MHWVILYRHADIDGFAVFHEFGDNRRGVMGCHSKVDAFALTCGVRVADAFGIPIFHNLVNESVESCTCDCEGFHDGEVSFADRGFGL